MDKATHCNIGPGQRRRRLLLGLPTLFTAFLGSLFSTNLVWPFVAFLGFLSIIQAQAGTCVALAAKGARNMDSGEQAVDDPEQQSYFQRQARNIYLRSFLATLVLLLLSQRRAVYDMLREALG